MIILWIILDIIVLLFATGVALASYYSQRSNLGEIHSPAEYGLEFEEVEFKAKDGVTLRGVWIPCAGSDKAVIILHGHGGSYDYDLYRVPPLVEAGFNVLLFDFRAHGRSGGNLKTFGYKERWDVLGAIEFLHSRGIQHIGLLGFSYGGLTAMLVTPISPDVEAMVTDGGPARLLSGAAGWAIERGVPAWVGTALGWLMFAVMSLRFGANLFKYEPVRWVGKISPRPIFFIHGDHDQYLPDFDDLYAAAREPKFLWRMPEAGHTTASQLYPEEHTRRVVEFFKQYL